MTTETREMWVWSWKTGAIEAIFPHEDAAWAYALPLDHAERESRQAYIRFGDLKLAKRTVIVYADP